MKTLKRVLVVLCIVLLIGNICAGNKLIALAEEFFGAGDKEIEEVQSTEETLDQPDDIEVSKEDITQTEPEATVGTEVSEMEPEATVGAVVSEIEPETAQMIDDDTPVADVQSIENEGTEGSLEPIPTVQTVDSTALGVTMRMVNFNKQQTDIGGAYKKNVGRTAGLLTSTVQENGYPRSINGDVDFEDWFGENASGDNIGSVQQVNHLFLQSEYDKTGYLSYSCFDNYAYLDQNTGNFTVYDAIGTQRDVGDWEYYHWRGNFMPYNNIVPGRFSTNTNRFSPDGTRLQPGDKDYEGPLYLAEEPNDYYFGMYIESNFAQAKGGIYKGSPMRFNFNGDDDLWVYIDGVLVLDIGGIHDAQSGYIDFRTGEVHVEALSAGIGTDTTIKGMFEAAGKDTAAGFKGNTFEDYSSHKIQVFYMERGAGASNLQMSFNLPVIPEEAVEVSKELSNTDKEKYANVEFAFQVWAQEEGQKDAQGNVTYTENYVPINGAKYRGTDRDITFSTQTIDGKQYENVFYLKPGETARFSNLQANRKYYVKEIGVKATEYDKVFINDAEYTEYNEDQQVSGRGQDIVTDEKEVSARPMVVFTNRCSVANSNELRMTKQMAGNLTTTDTFTFQVELEDQSGALADYAGDYYLVDAYGNYYYYVDNSLVSNGQDAKVCGTTTDGKISGIPAGYTAVITELLSGTDFRVTEVDLDTTRYVENYEKTLTENTYDPADIAGADGKIALGPDAEVTITNDMYQNVYVEKQWTDGAHTTDTVYAGLYMVTEQNALVATDKYAVLSWNSDPTKSWKGAFTDLDYDKTFSVKELRPVQGNEIPDFTIEGQGYVPVEENEIIHIGDRDYKVAYDSSDDNSNFIIINKRLSTLKIDKVKADNHETKLGGAKFKLQKQVDGQFEDVKKDGQIYEVTTDANGYAAFEALEDGTYRIIETEAPADYVLLPKPIEITLAYEKPADGKDDQVSVNDQSQVTLDDGKIVYYDVTQTVENFIGHELPDTGGPGTYRYSIGGILLMIIAATLIFYKYKRKETCDCLKKGEKR